jgi:hypothetical protein
MTAAVETPRPARKKPARTVFLNARVGCLLLTIGEGAKAKGYGYWIDLLQHDLGASVRCRRLTKFATQQKPGEPDHYDVVVGPTPSCECRGWLRWGHCKHLESLTALADAGRLDTPPAPEPCCHADTAVNDQDGERVCCDCGVSL